MSSDPLYKCGVHRMLVSSALSITKGRGSIVATFHMKYNMVRFNEDVIFVGGLLPTGRVGTSIASVPWVFRGGGRERWQERGGSVFERPALSGKRGAHVLSGRNGRGEGMGSPDSSPGPDKAGFLSGSKPKQH